MRFFDIAAGAAHTLALRILTNHLTEHLSKLLASGDYSDVSLSLGSRSWPLHSALVQARCPKLLQKPNLSTLSAATAQRLLSFIYTDKLEHATLSEAEVKELHAVAKQLELSALVEWTNEMGAALIEGRFAFFFPFPVSFSFSFLLLFLPPRSAMVRNRIVCKGMPVAASLRRLLSEELGADFELRVADKGSIRCHRCLVSRLDLCAAALRAKMNETQKGFILLTPTVHKLSLRTVLLLLSLLSPPFLQVRDLVLYLYTGEYEHIGAESALQLIANAGYLTLTTTTHRALVQHCAHLVLEALTLDNCLDLLQAIPLDELPRFSSSLPLPSTHPSE